MTKKALFECIGTFLLVFIGTGSVSATEYFDLPYPSLIIGILFGIAVWIPIRLFGKESGAHLNPAVTIAFLWRKELDIKTALVYILAQCIGAVEGSFAVRYIFPTTQTIGMTTPSGSYYTSFLLETGLTMVLMFVILWMVYSDRLKAYAIHFIAGTVALEAFLFGAISGASMNPARSIGPAVVSQNFDSLELYIVAPIAGALLANFIYGKISKI